MAPEFSHIPSDDFVDERPLADIPVTVRQRMNWSDVDSAQIGYTARHVALALDAIEIWWEQVMASNYWELRKQGHGSPSVQASIEFFAPVRPAERTDNKILVERLGNSSLVLRVDGYNQAGVHCYTARQTAVHVEGVPDAPKALPFNAEQRARIEGYIRECELAESGVKTKRQIIDYWFAPPGSPERGRVRPDWFGGGERSREEIDSEVRAMFAASHAAALRGDLDHWQQTPMGALALVLLLDQMPRHLFRGSGDAFASDHKALAVAQAAIAAGHDGAMGGLCRQFLYLPFEHSEDLAIQRRSVELFSGFTGTPIAESTEKYARMHCEIIERFGRFPHRNDALGRTSTAEEIAFLEDEAVRFGQ